MTLNRSGTVPYQDLDRGLLWYAYLYLSVSKPNYKSNVKNTELTCHALHQKEVGTHLFIPFVHLLVVYYLLCFSSYHLHCLCDNSSIMTISHVLNSVIVTFI